jgi:hypothetical protein
LPGEIRALGQAGVRAMSSPPSILCPAPPMPAESLADQLLDTWRIHHRINLYLLDAITGDALADVGATKGRSVGKTFAHLHNL